MEKLTEVELQNKCERRSNLLKKGLMAALSVSLLVSAGWQAVAAETEIPETGTVQAVESEAQTEAGMAQTGKVTEITFTDDLGREVTVSQPQRVAALLGSYADIWYLAGGTVVASADDAWDDFGLELPEDAVNLGNTKDPSLEKLFVAEPDFIIASTKTRANMDMLDMLEATGIPTAYFDVSDFEGYLRMLKICTEITGQPERYETYGVEVQAQIDGVIEASRKRLETEEAPKVLFLRASASSIRAKNSEGTILGEMLAALGCINIADSEESLLENLNIEYILQEDPDYIFTVQSGDDAEGMQKALDELFGEASPWSKLTAVKEGRVYQLDKRLYNLKPNARWGEAYEILEGILADE